MINIILNKLIIDSLLCFRDGDEPTKINLSFVPRTESSTSRGRSLSSRVSSSTPGPRSKSLGSQSSKPAKGKVLKVSKADYRPLVQDLSSTIKQALDQLQRERGKEVKMFPSQKKKEIINSFMESKNLADGCVNTKWLWDAAATMARDGKAVQGKNAGEFTTAHKNHHKAETKAADSTAKGMGFVALFSNKEECSEFAERALECKDKREEYDKLIRKLGGDDKEVEAMAEMEQVVPGKCVNCTLLLHLFSFSPPLIVITLCINYDR